MNLKKERLSNCRLYLILDASVNSYDDLLKIAASACKSGVDIMQLRDKHGSTQDILRFSKAVLKISRRKILYIINDRIDLAMAAQADGVHLGQDDLSVSLARKILGTRAIIGRSCQTLEHLKAAQKEKADYVGFGSVFKTQTKPDRSSMDLNVLRKAVSASKIPLFAIGGINLENLEIVKNVGVKRVAVCREICLANNISNVTVKFKELLRG